MASALKSETCGFEKEIPAFSREVLRDIDQKVIAFLRALSAGDTKTAETIEQIAHTAEPVAAFGEKGAAYLRQALEDARACFALVRADGKKG